MRIRLVGLCCLGFIAFAHPGAQADGVFRDSVGATSSGRGGANIAHSDNGAILLSNPAGMVNVCGDGLFEFGIDSLVTDLRYSDPQNSGIDEEFAPTALPEVAVIFRSPDENWAAGFGVFVPAGFGAEWNMNGPFPITGPQEYRSLGALAKILPGASVRLTDRLSVGATLGLAVSHAELEGPFFVQTGMPGLPTILDLSATGAALTWSVGLQYILSERTTLGLTYSSETRFNLEGDADATVFAGPPALSGFDAELELIWPQSAGIGVKHLLSERQRISADVVWIDWSSAFDELRLKLSNPTNPGFIPLSPLRDRFPLNWDDVISVRLGYEFLWTPNDVLRAGYIYNSQALPESTMTPYIPGILRHAISAGYGHRWRKSRFDIAYQFAFSDGRDVYASGLVGGDFNNSSFDAQAHWLFLSYTKEF